jgi:hypothetical protein
MWKKIYLTVVVFSIHVYPNSNPNDEVFQKAGAMQHFVFGQAN